MKKLVLLLFSALFVLSAQAGDVLRLMTYNVRNARGMDNSCNYQRVANVINNARPDVVAVQELDSMTTRSNGADVLRELAERTQLHPYFAPAIDYDGGKYGIGLLAKEAPLRLQTFALPGREEARTLIVAEFPEYIFGCTHLSLTEEDRMKSLEILKSVATSAEKPFFLAGDFNSDADSGFIKELKNTFQVLSNPKQPTYPASEPKETLDYLIALKQENLLSLLIPPGLSTNRWHPITDRCWWKCGWQCPKTASAVPNPICKTRSGAESP